VPRPETPTPTPSSSPVTVPGVLPGDEDRRVVEAVEEILRGKPGGPVRLLRELAKTPALSARSLRLIAAVFAQVGSDADEQKVRARIFTTELPAPKHRNVMDVFTLSTGADVMGEELVDSIATQVRKNSRRLWQEIRQTGELSVLLARAGHLHGAGWAAAARAREGDAVRPVAQLVP